MCGRYTFTQTPDPELVVLPEGFEIETGPRYNLAPGQFAPVIQQADPEHIHYMRWGLIPAWARDEKIGYKMINARAETLADKPAFRGPVRQSRCLVMADGFYEWKKTGAGKQPFRITLKDESPFYFAGIYDRWHAPIGYEIMTFSIITTEPNELMTDIHDRMPAILTPDQELIWMDPDRGLDEVLAVLKPYESIRMNAYPVSPQVGNVRNDNQNLVLPYHPPPTLF